MSKNTGNRNKSSSGSPMSGYEDMQDTRQRAAQRARESPVSPAGSPNYRSQYDSDVGIFDDRYHFTPPPPSPGNSPQQGSRMNVSPSPSQNSARQVTSQQGSLSHLAPPQNTTRRGDSETRGRQYTQIPREGSSTRPESRGGSNLQLNVPSPRMYENLTNRSRSGTGTPNTPNTAQPPVPPAFQNMQATGVEFHSHTMPQSAFLTRPAAQPPVPKAPAPKTVRRPTPPANWPGPPNPRPAGISFEWTERDKNFDWNNCKPVQASGMRASLLARDRGLTSNQVSKLSPDERSVIMANLRARGIIPPSKNAASIKPAGRPKTRDENFDWVNCTRNEKDYQRVLVLTRDQGILQSEWKNLDQQQKEAAVRQAVAKGLLPASMEPGSKGKEKGTKSSQLPPAPVASPSQASSANATFGSGRGQTDRGRSRAGSRSLYESPSPARTQHFNAIPGVTNPGVGGGSPPPTTHDRRRSLASQSGSRPPPTERSRGRSLTSRTGSRPPPISESRGRTPVSQRLGAPGGSTGPTVPTNRSPPAKPSKAEAAAAKKEQKAREARDKAFAKQKADEEKLEQKKRKADAEAEKKTNAKRAAQAKKASPKPQPKPQPKPKPGPSGGGKRK
ncbi:hypothetical protein HBI56_005300 [Parastagonospora nodorum]|uniref:Uncharacterized protein n=1 Tax=Phaeosphaeria nodorum (strain SN15 / ATCC MYA-4574 / FGSC 10173) TaxID=321614 RepID=A0A7U2HWG2_PHANO|nr:hypothetical protein HBH56_124370 [Parastagonospora nodorum]QRC91201.1 hypothetical protein JI435_426580 [Parastagonospora nodorum SN15]KAH3934905.1 hypothetical protein HBH54_049910 [Parastagonospora nodorum]KAH3950368.1 hypothetical protein HBH53_079450 [Parastagonospora nodorum]KAH3982605.1 hypothetical protein HBH51_037220 [Parastagonospora nodorum]